MKKTLILTTFFVSLILLKSCNIAAGSYPYAETYELDINHKELSKIISNFKLRNPELSPPLEVNLYDGKRNSQDKWTHFYFYYDNKIFKTWIRPKNKSITDFAFIGINNSLVLGNWKMINKDLNYIENDKIKQIFEKEILTKIKIIIKQNVKI